MVVQSGADNSSMGKIYLPFTNQRRYEHTPVHFLFMCILQIEDAPILLQHTFFILIEFPSQRWAQNYLTQFKIFSWSLVRPVHALTFSPSLLITCAYGQYFYVGSGSTCDSCVPLIYLHWSPALLEDIYPLVRPVRVFMFSPSLLITRAYGQYNYVGSGSTCDSCVQLMYLYWSPALLVTCAVFHFAHWMDISGIISGCIAIGVLSSLCSILPWCFLYSSCTAGLNALRSCSETVQNVAFVLQALSVFSDVQSPDQTKAM